MSVERIWNSLSDEMKEKAAACKNAESLAELVETEGLELDDAELDAIAGGSAWEDDDGNTPHVAS